MPKASGLPNLKLSNTKETQDELQSQSPPKSPKSPGSLHSTSSHPGSPRLSTIMQAAMFAQATNGIDTLTGPLTFSQDEPETKPEPALDTTPATTVPGSPPSSSAASPKHGRDPSKSFFSNLMASKSSHRLHSPEASIAEPPDWRDEKGRASSAERTHRQVRSKGSTPDLPRLLQSNDSIGQNGDAGLGPSAFAAQGDEAHNQSRKPRSKLGGIINRTKSIRLDDSRFKARSPTHLNIDTDNSQHARSGNQYPEPLKTAPVRTDYRERLFSDDADSAIRNRSADRQSKSRQDDNASVMRKDKMGRSHPFRDGSGLLSGLQHTGKGMGDRLGRAGKGFFGKMTRSGSTPERENVGDDSYLCTVINLPLVKQTRKTRIARRLEVSKDKTEFWMPALPWRCIDYLNMNGCEEEGLYRIPGSNREVRRWQRRFDTEYDINLFDEPELYDINTIGSMFKSWLRDLPEEILPRKTQAKIAAECAGATETPKLLKDELSKLPPFQYYLLFAITCHLSLLHGFSDKNKMDYRNLCICFQPCLRIDGFCFQFLVQDWKSCWQGCWTEKAYLEEEYRWEKEGSINENATRSDDERAVSSSGSSQHQPQQAASQEPRPGGAGKAGLSRSVKHKASLPASVPHQNGNSSSTQKPPLAPVPNKLRVVTPEPQIISTDRLPELKGLSPIKF